MIRTSAFALVGLASLAIAACSADATSPADPNHSAAHETTSTTASALSQGEYASFTQSNLQVALGAIFTNFYASTVTFENGSVVYTPSSPLSKFIYGDPNAAAHKTSYPVPTVNYSPSWPLPNVSATLTAFSVDVPSITFTMTGSEVDVDVPFTGNVHIHTSFPWPDADLVVSTSTVHAAIMWSPTAQRFSVSHVDVNLQDHVQNCGAFDWCDDIVQNNIPNMSGQLAGLIQSTLNGVLAGRTVTPGFYALLLASWNLGHENDYGGGPPWTMLAGYPVTLQNGEFDFNVIRDVQAKLALSLSTSTASVTAYGSTGFWATTSGDSGPVSFSASGLPQGVTAAFGGGRSYQVGDQVDMGFWADGTASPGTAQVLVTASANGVSSSQMIELTVDACQPATKCSGACGTISDGCGGTLKCKACPSCTSPLVWNPADQLCERPIIPQRCSGGLTCK